jgi:pimeloyl-ACP methyl ester carboxylesterase
MWRGVEPELHAAGLRTLALDQRGYSPGARPADAGSYRMAECVADALAVLGSLGIGAAHVVGHDWGSAVAWHLAARYPDRVRTLTAVSVPHPLALTQALATDPEQRERSAYMRLFSEVGKAEQVLLAEGAQRLRALFTPVAPEPYLPPLLVPGALTAALNWYRAMSKEDNVGFGAVAVPTTYVWSDADVALGRTAAGACAAYVTGEYRFVTLPGVSHWIADEAPEALAAEILRRVMP